MPDFMMVNHIGDFPTVLKIAKAFLEQARLGPERGLVIQIKRNHQSRKSSDDFTCCVDLEPTYAKAAAK